MGEAGGAVGAGLALVTFRGGNAGGPELTEATGAEEAGGVWFRRKILSNTQSTRKARAMPNGAVMSQAGLRMVYSVTPQRIATK